MTNNRETQRKALDKYFDLIKDKKNRRVAFRGYLTFFPRFFRTKTQVGHGIMDCQTKTKEKKTT